VKNELLFATFLTHTLTAQQGDRQLRRLPRICSSLVDSQLPQRTPKEHMICATTNISMKFEVLTVRPTLLHSWAQEQDVWMDRWTAATC